MSKPIMSCDKCTTSKPPNRVALTMHGACDLKPAHGFKGSCALKTAAHQIDTDTIGGGEKPERKGRK